MRRPGSDPAQSKAQTPIVPYGRTEDTGVGLFGGLCLFLSAVDYLIPKPLPFMRLGLANLPLLIALFPRSAAGASEKPQTARMIFSLREYCLLLAVKVVGQALITGSLFSWVFLFSLAGTAGSAAVMYCLGVFRARCRVPLSLAGAGLCGAFISNAAQLVLARFLLLGESVRYLTPPFLGAGIVSGLALGLFAEAFCAQSAWVRKKSAEIATAERPRLSGRPDTRAALVFALGLFMTAVFLVIPSLAIKAALLALFFLAAIFRGKRVRPLFTLIVTALVTLVNLFPPFGKVLCELGPFTLAQGSLIAGIRKAVTLEGLFMLSSLMITPALRFPGAPGAYLGESFAVLARLNGRPPADQRRGKLSPLRLMRWLDETLLYNSKDA
ncbi:MAG: Gx transporter family protein [Treponema sp.]|jgi:heptaprenyl diphosphate synthase|nr:Gx transporter family protein [Treponema sp.]